MIIFHQLRDFINFCCNWYTAATELLKSLLKSYLFNPFCENYLLVLYIYHHTTSILTKLSTWCFEHFGDISCSESREGRNTCMWIYILYIYILLYIHPYAYMHIKLLWTNLHRLIYNVLIEIAFPLCFDISMF